MTGKRYSRLILAACLAVAWPVGAQSVKPLGPDDFSQIDPNYNSKLKAARQELSAEQEQRRKLEQDAAKDKKRVKELEQTAAAEKQRIKELEDALRRAREARAEAPRPAPLPSTGVVKADLARTQQQPSYGLGGFIQRADLARPQPQPATPAAPPTTTVGQVFKDCPDCPEMVVIPAGVPFTMGDDNSPYPDERPAHPVTISKAFALGKTEVTQAQWRAVMGSNPPELYFKNCGDDCPVERVSWNDVQEFIKKLNAKTGQHYRLPSEAEWEYACRAGGKHKYCGSDDVGAVAWYGENSGGKTHPAAKKQKNDWGLYDMSGNVWEWVEDCYHDSYKGAPMNGSAWASGSCTVRVARGGSWDGSPDDARAANRIRIDSSDRYNDTGFRLARMLP